VDSLQEGNKVRESQERLLQCLQTYTIARCPEFPSKFGELLLKIPELQRICQVWIWYLLLSGNDGIMCDILIRMFMIRLGKTCW